MIENLVIDSGKLNFLSSSTVYEENIGDVIVATNPSMTPTSIHTDVKYHWFRHRVGK